MATDIELNTKINTANSAKSLGELRGSLKDLIALQSQVASGSASFEKLSKAINDTEGRLGDLNDSFSTLRGSGVERLNSSLGLLKEGLASGDVDKAKIAFKGLGNAMSAIPIFLLIEGFKALIDNWDDVVAFGKKLIGSFSESEQNIKKLTEEAERQTIATAKLSLEIKREISIMEARGDSHDKILIKKKELIRQETLEAISIAKTNIAKLQQIKNEDSLYESYLRTFAVKARQMGFDEQADKLDKQIAINKAERAGDSLKILQEQQEKIKDLQTQEVVETIKVEKEKEDIYKKKSEEKLKTDAENRKKQLDAFSASLEEDTKFQEKQDAEFQKKEEERQKKADEFNANEDKFREENAKKEIALNEEVMNQKKSMRDRDLAEERAIQNAKFQIASNAITSIQGLSDLAFSIRQANTKKGSAEEEKSARKQFQLNKALQIASATISGAQGILQAATQPSGVPIPFDIPFRVAKAIAIGATTGATIAKISATQFQSTGGGGSSSGGVSVGGGGSASPVGGGASLPLSNVRATNFRQDTVGQVGGPGGANTPGNNNGTAITKVVLLEGDVTRVQNKVSVTESQAKW